LKQAEFPFGRALITGGAGFVGSHLAQRLLAYGTQVTILDNLSSGFESNVPKQARLVKGDVRDSETVKSVAKGTDIIFHLAEYIPNYPGHVIRYSASNPREDLDVCVGGTINVLEEARRNNAHFVLTSTAAIYGSKNVPMREDMQPEPISPYGAAKLCAELYAQLYYRVHGLRMTIFRFFNLFGPRQRKYVMYDCLLKLRRDPRHLELLGDGREIRDYIFVDDAIDRIFSLIPISHKEPVPIFNIGTGKGRATIEVVKALCRKLAIDPEITFQGNPWSGNSSSLLADVSKTGRYCEENLMNFEESLEKLIVWFSKEETPLSPQT
jgi:UDP-glucose 4-epimerase